MCEWSAATVFVKTIGSVADASSPDGMAGFFSLWAKTTVEDRRNPMRIVRFNVNILRYQGRLASLSGSLTFLTFAYIFLTFVYPDFVD